MTDYSHHVRELIKVNENTFDHTARHHWFNSRTDDVLVRTINGIITIDIKGTERTWVEWLCNFWVTREEWRNFGCVERGFSVNAEELLGREDQPESLINLVLNSDLPVLFRGHSRGCPISILLATLFVAHGVDRHRVKLILFGAPKLGDTRFKREYNELLGDCTTVINGDYDVVTKVPFWGHHHGTEKRVDLFIHSLRNYEKVLMKRGVVE